MPNYPLVVVEWEDSKQPTAGWQWLSAIEKHEPVIIRSAGWLVHDDKIVKALASNLSDIEEDGDRQASGVIRIPTRCVRQIVHLNESSCPSS